MTRFEFDLQPIVDGTRILARGVQTPTGLAKALGVKLMSTVQRVIRVGGVPPWKPLAASTQAAKRQGKGRDAQGRFTGGTGRPLAGFANRIDVRAETATRVVVEVQHPAARFQHEGTSGPYPIVARNAKALALPFLPGRDAGKGSAGTGKAGFKSFKGLSRARARPGGGFIKGGKRVQPVTNVAFYQRVMHPGLVARPLLPPDAEVQDILRRAAEAFLRRQERA